MIELAGKTALITGGGGGIGGGMAEAFVEAGMNVMLADIELDFAQAKAAELGAAATAITLDVTSLESWASAKAITGEVDILCNNAGIAMPFQSLLDTDPALFERIMKINVTGVYKGIRTFAPAMKARKSGHIVNTSSVNGLIPHGPFAAYCASKFAVLGLSDSLRLELAPFGVGVSVLFPGLTRSRMSMAVKEDMGLDDASFAGIEANMMDPLWMGQAVVKAIQRNQPYIITHPDHKAVLEDRHAAILSAFGEPAQPGYGLTAGSLGGLGLN
jgi:NAD(P)-dependent dehydrogenase (short-subunit alcohol dehydrogenase family)